MGARAKYLGYAAEVIRYWDKLKQLDGRTEKP
jgi:hypothetical protein